MALCKLLREKSSHHKFSVHIAAAGEEAAKRRGRFFHARDAVSVRFTNLESHPLPLVPFFSVVRQARDEVKEQRISGVSVRETTPKLEICIKYTDISFTGMKLFCTVFKI